MEPDNKNQEPLNSPGQVDTERPPGKNQSQASYWQRFRSWYSSHKKLSLPITIIFILFVLVAVPSSRYKGASLIIKKDYSVLVIDSETKAPVSGALVSIDSHTAQTNGNGTANLRQISAGPHTLFISKKYYSNRRANITVPLLKQKQPSALALDATGRQVKITVKNLINKQTLANVDIKVADTTAKTDNSGQAVVVLPVGIPTQKAKLKLIGYNNSEVTVNVSDSTIAENNFTLTPTGKVYFLSKRSGKLNLMKSDLDGSNTEVVVAGTGNEQNYGTAIMPSTDWKYVALLSKREAADPTPQLFILSTADDKLLNVDSGDANFTLKGWSGDKLIYYVTRNNIRSWQPGKDKLKSYDASTGKTVALDQSSATGDSSASAYEYYALVTIYGNSIIFAKNWTEVYDDSSAGLLNTKNNTVSTISADGLKRKIVSSYSANDNVQYTQHSPNSIYIWQQVGSSDKFFDYSFGYIAPKSISLTSDQFYHDYPLYYPSASGKQTFWAESRDGKNTLFIGDYAGLNSSQIASQSKYSPYGWYTDQYLLVTKDNSELYVMSNEGGDATKITDYQPTTYSPGY